MSVERVEIPGSAPKHSARTHSISAADPNQELTVTVVLRRPQAACDIEEKVLSGELAPLSREQASELLGASPQDLEAVRCFAQEYGLQVVSENPAARTVQLRGTIQRTDAAFGTHVQDFIDAEGKPYLSYEGPLSVPERLGGIVIAVLGLDQRRVARRRLSDQHQ